MLRASIEYQGRSDDTGSVEADLRAVTEGAKGADIGVAFAAELTTFAETAVGANSAALTTARDALRNAAGSAALIDTACVVANFQRMVRIADGAGIALDTAVDMLSTDFREELGLNQFESAGRSQGLGRVQRALAPLLRGVANLGLRTMGRRARKRASH